MSVTNMVDTVRGISSHRTTKLVVLAVIVGSGAGLGAVSLIESIALVSRAGTAFTQWLSIGRLALLLVIPLGLWLSWWITNRLGPEVAGHGVPQILAAISVRGGVIRPRVIPLKTVVTALTIGFGGSAGREGSIAQIGSAIGSWLARLARLNENDVIALVAAGAGAGISATFNAPIAGMFFAMEVILREISVRHLHTVVIASVSGAVVAHSILGDDLTFTVPQYGLDDPRHLVLYVILGLVAVAFGWFYMAALNMAEVNLPWLKGWMRAIVFGLGVAVLGLVWGDTLGTGQPFINDLLQNQMTMAWWVLGTLALVKAVATAVTLGGKGSGGIFMPSLFIGAAAGSGFARLVSPLTSSISAGAFGLVGMAATFAAVARAPLTAILIVFEITGDYGLVLPLMVATVVSTALATRVRPLSAYTSPLARKGINPAGGIITDLLDTVTVGSAMGSDSPIVEPRTPLDQVEKTMETLNLRVLPVADDGELVGLVAAEDMAGQGGAIKLVEDVMTRDIIVVGEATTVSRAMERMAALGVSRLVVVAAGSPMRPIGVFSRDDVVRAYHDALRGQTSHTDFADLGANVEDGAFSELEIGVDSGADGALVNEIKWPTGCILVSVHRYGDLIVPDGDTRLEAGDIIAVFGEPDSLAGVPERLR